MYWLLDPVIDWQPALGEPCPSQSQTLHTGLKRQLADMLAIISAVEVLKSHIKAPLTCLFHNATALHC